MWIAVAINRHIREQPATVVGRVRYLDELGTNKGYGDHQAHHAAVVGELIALACIKQVGE